MGVFSLRHEKRRAVCMVREPDGGQHSGCEQAGRQGGAHAPETPRKGEITLAEQTNKERKHKRSVGRRIRTALCYTGFVLVTLVLIGMTTAAICGMAFAVYINRYVSPEIDVDLDSVRLNLTSFIYYVDPETGEEKELETLYGDQNRVWVDIDNIPEMMQKAFIAVEDERFYSHNGVDWKRTIGAALNYVIKFRDNYGGGSTITQQLIKNITGDNETSVKRKIQEVMRALELEKKYEKGDILELYLNTIYFGQSAYGVQSAAQTYFGKDVAGRVRRHRRHHQKPLSVRPDPLP